MTFTKNNFNILKTNIVLKFSKEHLVQQLHVLSYYAYIPPLLRNSDFVANKQPGLFANVHITVNKDPPIKMVSIKY